MESESFSVDELKNALERSLGFTIVSLKRLGGSASLNLKAVRDSDGMAFAVKCSPPKAHVLFDRLVEHLDALRGTKAVQRVFEHECLSKFSGYNVLCTAWCDGRRMLPCELTDEQFRVFLDDYCDFSNAMQRVKTFDAERPYLMWKNDAAAKCTGLGRILMHRIWRDLSSSACVHDPKQLRIIHSDFHQGNFLFVNGHIERILDVEGLRLGYPAEDIVRYIVCSADHLRFSVLWNRRRILSKFAIAVQYLPYSLQEWVVAINGNFLRLVFMRTHRNRKIGFWKALSLVWRYRLYRQMKDMCLKFSNKG